MRVLFVSCCPREHAVTRYRCTHLAEALQFAGHRADVTWIGAPLIRIDHDIVVLHRICANQEGIALAGAVERAGATLVYGTDDLVFDPDAADLPEDVARFAELHLLMLRRAENLLASTDSLAEAACAWIPNVDVIGNFPGETMLAAPLPERPPGTKFTLGYFSGSSTHDADFAIITEPLAKFLTENAEKVRLRVVGPVVIPDSITNSGAEIEHLPLVPWQELPALVAGCHINLVPLTSTPLNEGKSAIKWQEASLARVPTIASPVGEFVRAIDHGKDGLLCATPDDWYNALRLLYIDPSRRAGMVSAAFVAVHNIAKVRRVRVPKVFENAMPKGTPWATTFKNPRGFVKSVAKKALGRV
ncbi:MAG: glycosyltransferase [Armatimonas sp.]